MANAPLYSGLCDGRSSLIAMLPLFCLVPHREVCPFRVQTMQQGCPVVAGLLSPACCVDRQFSPVHTYLLQYRAPSGIVMLAVAIVVGHATNPRSHLNRIVEEEYVLHYIRLTPLTSPNFRRACTAPGHSVQLSSCPAATSLPHVACFIVFMFRNSPAGSASAALYRSSSTPSPAPNGEPQTTPVRQQIIPSAAPFDPYL
ncbi:hypothetical protein GE09DRAFT_23983 [Coniochaeta sp. 2T2.1]|nr:hypothetical protein GE09DRAFT_23983 [Coniochaeta sp. 2T2.1]